MIFNDGEIKSDDISSLFLRHRSKGAKRFVVADYEWSRDDRPML